MSGKRKSVSRNTGSFKKSRKPITLEVKLRILNLHESGMKVNQLAAKFKISHSTVSTILKHKDKYLDQVKRAMPMQSTVVRKREGLIPEVEKILIAWVNHRTETEGTPLSQPAISAKALSVFEKMKKERGEGTSEETFTASKGWFDRFRKRAGWRNVRETPGADTAPRESFSEGDWNELSSDILDPEETQLFNADVKDSGEDLIQMVKQEVVEEEEEEAPTPPGFTTQRLSEAFRLIESGLNVIESDDPNFERSSTVVAAIRNDYACYREIYNEKKKASFVKESLD